MQPSIFFEHFVSRVSRLVLEHPKLSVKYLYKSRGGDDGVKNAEEMREIFT
jgi:hypothetical protein